MKRADLGARREAAAAIARSYADACANATSAQGLDPVIDALTLAGVPVEVWQTGGFCMVAAVRDIEGDGIIAITGEVGAHWYPTDELQEDSVEIACAPSGCVYETPEQLADLVTRINAFRKDGARGCAVELRTQATSTTLSTHRIPEDAWAAAEVARATNDAGYPVVVAILSVDPDGAS